MILRSCNQIEKDWGLIREGNFIYSPPPRALRGKGESVEQMAAAPVLGRKLWFKAVVRGKSGWEVMNSAAFLGRDFKKKHLRRL